ncbi:TrbG/VirB9 family P-type conjugative transfer protein [Pseudoxanthomonas sp.]|uniref:TrbG/VirB9 family P-type conjugative transfer protein n=1 Tax=Pseudoxanthomonas sp. TaxID=1871049 RepID=UPI002604F4B9|nr:TrbG/VirB9 family P-type conjugative transfer protein [Pseudoxanthomonas sp.]WDS35483.1 MAG: TrbG/VirB9 family P-type conjugative transfer protein [Pseudoxanthomonas sp.]
MPIDIPTPARALGTGLLLWLAAAALPASADSRIREIDYNDRVVVRLEACYGFQTMIEFGADERIENVGLGEASQWLVVPNKRANLLFVKPGYKVSHSNMTVATDRHRYSFELVARDSEACKRGQVVYDLRFRYADPAPVVVAPAAAPEPATPVVAPMPAAEVRNRAYSFSGARENVPLRVFDDGTRTWFQWASGASAPAVFAVASDGSETLVGFTAQGDYLVADQVAPSFVLRRGEAAATLYNDGYRVPQLDAQSPQPRAVPAKRRFFLFGGKRDAQ